MILVVGILVNACGSDDKDDSPKKADTSSEQKEEKKEEKSFTVGDTAEYKDVQVTLNGIEKSEGSEFNKPADGKIFVTAEFTITNNSGEDLLISSIGNFEAYFDGLASTLDVGATADQAGKKTQLDGSVAAGKAMKGIVGYQVPKDWKEGEIRFTSDMWTKKNFTFTFTN